MAEERSTEFSDEPQDDLLLDETEEEDVADATDSADEEGSPEKEAGTEEEDSIDGFAKGDVPGDAASQKSYWQAALTRARQKDREKTGTLTEEHRKYAEVLRNFFADDQYAMQVIKQRFPQVAHQIMQQQGTGTPAVSQGTQSDAHGKLVSLLQGKLGSDLGFLAPALADAMQAAVGDAMAPLHQQTRTQQEQSRRREEESLMAEMDSAFPGWEDQHGQDMQELNRFLTSNELTHPKYGNRYSLLYKMTNKDQARIDAVQGMQKAQQSRVGTGRTGRVSPANTIEQIQKATTKSDAFRLAAEAAIAEMRGR